MDRLERTRLNNERRKRLVRKWVIRLAAGAIGVGLGKLCDFLPEDNQILCHVAAKVFAFLGGGQ